MEKELNQVKQLLLEVLLPTPSTSYITCDEIDINDEKIKKALSIVNKLLNK